MAAYTAVVTPTAIKLLGESGTFTTLSLPTGITMTGLPARIVRLNNNIIITGCVSAPVWLGSDLVLRALVMPTPDSAPTLAVGAAGTYTGTRRCRVSFILRDAVGRVIAEGPLGPESSAVAFTADQIDGSAVPVPPTGAPVTDRRIYFTAAGGSVYFHAFDLAGTTTTTFSTQIADAALAEDAASDELVAAPIDIDLVAVWKNRVWARSGLDTVVGTSAGRTDRWPNAFEVDAGVDGTGITGFLARRDDLGIPRRDRFWKMVGDSESDFALVKVVDGKGCISAGTCKVIRDVGYFLSDDGVYTWSGEGILSISDETVRPWFTTDTYFNRSMFSSAFAEYNPITHRYLLFLAAAGSTVIDRWVEFDILTGRWFGPNRCAAVTNFLSAAVAPDANNVLRVIVGADDGYLYAFDPSSSTDGPSSAIDFDVTGKHHDGGDPDKTHAWLQLSLFTKAESSGTLTVTPYLGDIAASAGTAQSASLTLERQRLARLGVGRLCALRFRENTAGKPVTLYGYKLPFVTLGRR